MEGVHVFHTGDLFKYRDKFTPYSDTSYIDCISVLLQDSSVLKSAREAFREALIHQGLILFIHSSAQSVLLINYLAAHASKVRARQKDISLIIKSVEAHMFKVFGLCRKGISICKLLKCLPSGLIGVGLTGRIGGGRIFMASPVIQNLPYMYDLA